MDLPTLNIALVKISHWGYQISIFNSEIIYDWNAADKRRREDFSQGLPVFARRFDQVYYNVYREHAAEYISETHPRSSQ